ncbi:hypothetical protein KC19_5G026500 [Ceratodon purpureus]|uniref:tRNA/rRNA methyltransferase SpoU type domain-containing protein n=1 Tax=Ceratodon purpureus TaxID=3225 RepID=A0A8T0HYN3_CERPU|nr:hypothetical protein KC19_5G026500 [Ceratodon purpureus]
MEGALCHRGHCGKASGVELGFGNVGLQEWRRGSLAMPSFGAQSRGGVVARGQKRLQVEASAYDRSSGYRGGERVGFKDVYRRGDSGDGSSERRVRDGEMGRGRAEESSSSVELAGHVDTITSVQNPYVKHLVKLRTNTNYRNASGCVVVVGSVPLREICEVVSGENSSSAKPIKVLLVLEDTSPRADLRSWAERVVSVSEPVLRKVAGVDSTQGLQGVGVLALPSAYCNLEDGGDIAVNWVSSPRRVLVLDGIQDPGNLGTLLRTAAAFAWDGVFMLPGGCDPFNEKALRASRGASFRLPIATGRWKQLQSFADKHKMKLYAADPDQKDTWPSSRTEHISHAVGTSTETTDTLDVEPESDFKDVVSNENDSIRIAAAKEALCLILGSEGQGLSENAHRSCERVSIPMPGDFESLNVAVAGGILLYLLKNKIAVSNVAS